LNDVNEYTKDYHPLSTTNSVSVAPKLHAIQRVVHWSVDAIWRESSNSQRRHNVAFVSSSNHAGLAKASPKYLHRKIHHSLS